jgi:hypothetical protein
MKLKLSLFALFCAAPLLHGANFITESAEQFLAPGDYDDDGDVDLAILDRYSGMVRVLYRVTPGSVVSGGNIATGMENLSGVTSGRFDSLTKDALALTTPNANKIHLLYPEDPAHTTPIPVNGGPGSRTVTALDVPGSGNTAHDDLVITHGFGTGSLATTFVSLRNDGTTIAAPGIGSTINQQWVQPNALVPQTGASPILGVMSRTTNRLRVGEVSGNVFTERFNIPSPPSGWWATGFFGASTYADLLIWESGSATVKGARLGGSAGAWTIGTATNHTLPATVSTLMTYRLSSGQSRVFVAYENGTASSLNYADGTGFSGARAISLAGLSGSVSGAVALDGGHFLLTTTGADGSTGRYALFNDDGTTLSLLSHGALNTLSPRNSSPTVLLFDSAPLRNENALFLGALRAGDWTTLANLAGAPPTVTALRYQSAATGLGSSFSADITPLPLGSAAALVNQITPDTSLFALSSRAGAWSNDVIAEPVAGSYSEAVSVTLTAAVPAGATIFYRKGTSGSFSAYSTPIFISRDTTLQAYVVQSGDRSPIVSFSYDLTNEPQDQDSDADGVPDFVENSNGLDPEGGADSDGDGYSDLAELLAGTNPSSSASKPLLRSDSRDKITLTVTPKSIDPASTSVTVHALAGTEVSVYDVEGTLLGRDVLEGAGTAAVVECHPVDENQRFLIVQTSTHFAINTADTDQDKGRELVQIIPVPAREPVSVSFTYNTAATQSAESARWIAAASAAHVAATPASITDASFDADDVLAFALTEMVLGEGLNQRGTSFNKATFTPWRATERGSNTFRSITKTELRELAGPVDTGFYFSASWPPPYVAHSVHAQMQSAVTTPADAGMTALRKLARDIYRISAVYANAEPGVYDLPLDALRQVLLFSTLPAAYQAKTSLSSTETNDALMKASFLRYTSGLNRVAVTRTLAFVSQNASNTLAQLSGGGTTFSLIDLEGTPYELPEQWDLQSGSVMEVIGYEDTPVRGGYATITVARATLKVIELPDRTDSDGDLLADAWERFHYGNLSRGAFDIGDSSGFSLLHEYLAATDPLRAAHSPTGAPVSFTFSSTRSSTPAAATIRIESWWPVSYLDQFEIYVESSPDLATWTDTAAIATHIADGLHRAEMPIAGAKLFYRMRARLKP